MTEESKQQSLDQFYQKNHFDYLMSLDKSKDLDSIGSYLSEHLKVAGGYWTLNALACLGLLNQINQDKKEELIKWLKSCQNTDGGFGGNTYHDSHLTNTHYAILLGFILDCLDQLDLQSAVDYISKLQNQDGSFSGDVWGEVDARFSYCALSSLTLLQQRNKINIKKAAQYIFKFQNYKFKRYIKLCRNYDGSFGGQPDAESHGAYVFCCIGTLWLCDEMECFNHDDLATWLSERQTDKGGLNGRPEKLADVCYSWWEYSVLCIIKREKWINQNKLEQFILNCQDPEGGISDRPGNCVDVFHTFFGLAALSLLNQSKYQLKQIDPAFALPLEILNKKCQFAKQYFMN